MNLVEQATHVQSQLEQATARIAEMSAEHTAALAAKDAAHKKEIDAIRVSLNDARAAYDEKVKYQAAMEARVSEVLASGDPAQYEALAKEFLTPRQELERQRKLANLASLQAQAAAIEAELAVKP